MMKSLFLLWTMVHLFIQPLPSDSPEETWIEVDLWEYHLSVKLGSQTVLRFPIAVGKQKTPTSIGEWRVTQLSSGWGGGFGTHWIGLDVPWGQYGIHRTNRPTSIGRRSSHGCVRMRNLDVKQLYKMLSIGTRVNMVGPILGENRNADLPKRLIRGDRGSLVLLIQNRLRAAGYYRGDMDGIFGDDLERVIKKYQKDHHREVTGQIRIDDYRELGLLE